LLACLYLHDFYRLLSRVLVPVTHTTSLPEKFTRLEKPGSEKRGTGLGLAIARRIVELHDGRLVAGGQPGPITKTLQKKYRQSVQDALADQGS